MHEKLSQAVEETCGFAVEWFIFSLFILSPPKILFLSSRL
jgi:hypothetical protein